MAFNLSDLMNNSSKETAAAPAPAYEVVELDTADLIPNEKNNIYSIENIEDLKNAIELAGGIKQNLVVEPPNSEGKYKIIAGHRRWTAARELTAEGKEEYKKVPCLIEREPDAAKRELLLIYTNATARELTDAEKAKQAARATELLTDIKNREGITGRVRDLVADMLHTTAAQIGRYQAINKNLTNENLKEAFNNGELKVSAAYEASKLDAEGQAAAAEKLEANNGLSISDVKEIATPTAPQMMDFSDDGTETTYTGEEIAENLKQQPPGGVTESDTTDSEPLPGQMQIDKGIPWEADSTQQEAAGKPGGDFDNLPDEMEIQPWESEETDIPRLKAFQMVEGAIRDRIEMINDVLADDTENMDADRKKMFTCARGIYRDILSTLEDWENE